MSLRTPLLLAWLTVIVHFATSAQAQTSPDGVWSELDGSALDSYEAARTARTPWVSPGAFRVYQINEAAFANAIADAPMEHLDLDAALRPAPAQITIPMPDGTFALFEYVESPVMHPDLAANFPEIKTYIGQGIDDPAATIRFDRTPQGFHAQILSPNGAAYVDPYFDDTAYAVYWKKDFSSNDKEWVCNTFGASAWTSARTVSASLSRSGTQLRTYRLAVACTGEYAQFHDAASGQSAAVDALAAIVTTVNRVDGIYENELAIRMVLVANNNLIVFTNPATDGFSNGNDEALLTENQAKCDSVIGASNYDIGHVVSTGEGGLAGLGVVCVNGQKAQGMTGRPAPVGDPYDVDFVAHEMGHQFGGDHTFNGIDGACGNREATAAFEPGSGSTIQAYAGICGVDDLQPNSDPYFHSYSFDQMFGYASELGTCAVTTNTGNTSPTASAGTDFAIPKGTPFTLTGSGTDANGDTITYCWEQRDLGPALALSAPDNGSSPLFRSLNPTSSPSRTFPKWATILANTTDNAEKLPQLTRIMDFRLTVRDNRAAGGGVATDDMVVNVDATKGPFVVTSPNGGGSLSGDVTVTWNVAGTATSPVSTTLVDILLSVDGGSTFGTVLANDVPNDGSQTVTLPGAAASQARIMVRAQGNIFFDVSNANFAIEDGGPTPDPVTFTSADVPKAVVDGGTMTSTLNVPSSIQILDVDAALNISHTFVGDLVVQLTSPLGTTITLFQQVGGGGDNFTNTILDDEAATLIAAGTAPFTGSFVPSNALSAFDAQDGQGTWTLTVQDLVPEDGGSLNSWSISITPSEPVVDTSNIHVDFNYTGTETGSESEPFNTLGEGLDAVADSGTVWIEPGSTPDIGTINQDVALKNNQDAGGVVTLGGTP